MTDETLVPAKYSMHILAPLIQLHISWVYQELTIDLPRRVVYSEIVIPKVGKVGESTSSNYKEAVISFSTN